MSGPSADASADFTQITAGGLHTCGLRADGTVTCWGSDAGDAGGGWGWGIDAGGAGGQVSGPNADGAADFTQLAAGTHHTCGLRSDGSVTCWGVSGPNADGRADFTQVTAGNGFTCGLRSDGSYVCWGSHFIDTRALVVAAQ